MRCPVCSKEDYSKWGQVDKYTILTCNHCGLGITTPFPGKELLSATNDTIYQVEQRIRTYTKRRKYFEDRYSRYIQDIRKYKPNGKLLDIGCNIGLFLKIAQEQGYQVTGVELNESCAEYGRATFGLDIYSDYLENLKLPDQTFNIVTLYDVLEHVPDLQSFLFEVKRLIKPGGLLVIQSPNLESVMAGLTKSRWHWLTPPDHLYHFTPQTITELVKAIGFEVKEMKTWEPAGDFCYNLYDVYLPKGFFGRGLLRVLGKFNIALPVVSLLQKNWWLKNRGALLEIYAQKL